MSVANFLTTAVLGLVIIAAIIIGFSWLFARLYTRPKRRLRTETPDDYDLPFESITFKSHGKKLDGWFIPADGNPIPRPAIIAAHGWSNNASQMLPVARQLHEAGFGVLLYDARGHGASGNDGPMTILKFAEDLIAGIDYLQERRDVDTTRLGVVGHSIGAASAILAASNEPRIRALVSSSAFADPTGDYRGFHAMPAPPAPAFSVAHPLFHRALARNHHGRGYAAESNQPYYCASSAYPRRLRPIRAVLQYEGAVHASPSTTNTVLAGSRQTAL